jgi:hypothetical protein
MSWEYGLVKQSDGKVRLWEIYDEDNYYWGHKAKFSWWIKELPMVIKDLWVQKKIIKHLWDGKQLDKGTKRVIKYWNKSLNSKEIINMSDLK